MCEIVCVTNRALCGGDFLRRLDEIAACRPHAIILREKDLSEEEYTALAERAADICGRYNTKLILHNFAGAAIKLGIKNIHLPLHKLAEMSEEQRSYFDIMGASCHSAEDAVTAERLGCTYITAGHIFATDCKKGLAPRGVDFLREICARVDIPVYAIGGISAENMRDIVQCGAAGGCIMSGFMRCENVQQYMERLRNI